MYCHSEDVGGDDSGGVPYLIISKFVNKSLMVSRCTIHLCTLYWCVNTIFVLDNVCRK